MKENLNSRLRKKRHTTYRGTKIRMATEFSSETK
jgi:hypothetical protein